MRITKIAIHADDGERTIVFHPPREYDDKACPELGELIGDVMHWPSGSCLMQQTLGRVEVPEL